MRSQKIVMVVLLALCFFSVGRFPGWLSGQQKKPTIELASSSWVTTIDGERRIRLKVQFKNDEGIGQLMFDRNTIRFNAFGDMKSTTALALTPHKIKLKRLADKDPGEKGRRLYSITGKELPREFKLVVSQRGVPQRLVITKQGEVKTVIFLEKE